MASFEELYIKVRSKEQRVYTDEQVAHLPDMESSHPHFEEWKFRKESAEKLINYFAAKNKPLSILEIGCGNGWLSAKLAGISEAHVTGWDINNIELEQSKTVFKHKENLAFFSKSILEETDLKTEFDLIIFAASIQYFPSLKDVLTNALQLLKENGEIHILDSIFYSKNDAEEAKRRTELYYESMNVPEMAQYYFHHNLREMQNFDYKILFNPASLRNKLFGRKNPFYWIMIKSRKI